MSIGDCRRSDFSREIKSGARESKLSGLDLLKILREIGAK